MPKPPFLPPLPADLLEPDPLLPKKKPVEPPDLPRVRASDDDWLGAIQDFLTSNTPVGAFNRFKDVFTGRSSYKEELLRPFTDLGTIFRPLQVVAEVGKAFSDALPPLPFASPATSALRVVPHLFTLHPTDIPEEVRKSDERSARTRGTIEDLWFGRITPREAYDALQTEFEDRPFAEQAIAGAIFDPTNLIPFGQVPKLVGRGFEGLGHAMNLAAKARPFERSVVAGAGTEPLIDALRDLPNEAAKSASLKRLSARIGALKAEEVGGIEGLDDLNEAIRSYRNIVRKGMTPEDYLADKEGGWDDIISALDNLTEGEIELNMPLGSPMPAPSVAATPIKSGLISSALGSAAPSARSARAAAAAGAARHPPFSLQPVDLPSPHTWVPETIEVESILDHGIHNSRRASAMADAVDNATMVLNEQAGRSPYHPSPTGPMTAADLKATEVRIGPLSPVLEPIVEAIGGQGVIGRTFKKLGLALGMGYRSSDDLAFTTRVRLERLAKPFTRLIGRGGSMGQEQVDVIVRSIPENISQRIAKGLQGVVDPEEYMRSPSTILSMNADDLKTFYDWGPNPQPVLQGIESLKDTVRQVIKHVEDRTGKTWDELTVPGWAGMTPEQQAAAATQHDYFPRLVEFLSTKHIRGAGAEPLNMISFKPSITGTPGSLLDRQIADQAVAQLLRVGYFPIMDTFQRFMSSTYRFAVDMQVENEIKKLDVTGAADMADKLWRRVRHINQLGHEMLSGQAPNSRLAKRYANDSLFQSLQNSSEAALPSLVEQIELKARDAADQVAYFNSIKANKLGKFDPSILSDANYRDALEVLQAERKLGFQFLRKASDITNFMKFVRSGLDPSVNLIQTLPLMVKDPALWANRSAGWLHAWLHPEYVAYEDAKFAKSWAEGTRYGLLRSSTEWEDNLVQPGFTQKVMRWPVARRFDAAYSHMMNGARIRMWEAMQTMAKSEDDLYTIAQSINKITGSINPEMAGITPRQRMMEGTLLSFASGYRRSVAALTIDAFQGGVRGHIARDAMGKLLLAGSLVAGASYYFHEDNPSEEGFKKVTSWLGSPQFMSFKVPGTDQYVGFGSAWVSGFRLLANTYNQVTNERKEPLDRAKAYLQFDPRDNPFFRYWRSQAPPIASLLTDIFSTRNYLGESLYDEGVGMVGPKVFTHILKSMTPMATEQLLEEGQSQQNWTVIPAWLGFRTFPVSEREKLWNLREDFLAVDNDPAVVKWRNEHPDQGWTTLPRLLQRSITQRYATLDDADKKAMERDIRVGRTDQRVLATFESDLRTRTSEMKPKYEGLATRFVAGQMTNEDFRARLKELDAEYLGRTQQVYSKPEYIDLQARLNKEAANRLDKGEKFMLDLAYDAYSQYVQLNPKLENQYGELDTEQYKRLLLNIRQKYGEKAYEYIRSMQAAGHQYPEPIVEFRRAKDMLADYWDIPNHIFPAPSDQNLWTAYNNSADFQQAELVQRHPRLGYLIGRVREAREEYRRKHPEADVVLTKWYGNTPTTPEGAAYVRAATRVGAHYPLTFLAK